MGRGLAAAECGGRRGQRGRVAWAGSLRRARSGAGGQAGETHAPETIDENMTG